MREKTSPKRVGYKWLLAHVELRKMVAFYFLAGFVLWYSVEKIFLVKIGLSPLQMTSLISIAFFTEMVAEFPSSVLADRWSRSKSLALSSICASIAAGSGFFAHSFETYLPVVIFWGLASALFSGTSDALSYDILKKDGDQEHFGVVSMMLSKSFLLGLLVSSLISTFIGKWLGMPMVYLLSVPTTALAAVPIYLVNEPNHHKADQAADKWAHIGRTIKYLFTTKKVLLLALVVIAGVSTGQVLDEFYSLWFVYLSVPFVLIGVAKAFSTTLLGVVTPLSVTKWIAARQIRILGAVSASIVLLLISFLLGKNLIAIITFSFAVLLQAIVWNNVISKKINDEISSSERASTNSLISLLRGLFWVVVVSPLTAKALGISGRHFLLVPTFGFTLALLVLLLTPKLHRASR